MKNHSTGSLFKPGDIVSTAKRISDSIAYDAAVHDYKTQHPGYTPLCDKTSCSFKLDDDTEMLFVWQPKGTQYVTDCTIEYELFSATSLNEFIVQYYFYAWFKGFNAIEPPGKSLLGAGDGAHATERGVMAKGGSYKGAIINPAYPFVLPRPRKRVGYGKYVAVLVGGIVAGVALSWFRQHRRR